MGFRASSIGRHHPVPTPGLVTGSSGGCRLGAVVAGWSHRRAEVSFARLLDSSTSISLLGFEFDPVWRLVLGGVFGCGAPSGVAVRGGWRWRCLWATADHLPPACRGARWRRGVGVVCRAAVRLLHFSAARLLGGSAARLFDCSAARLLGCSAVPLPGPRGGTQRCTPSVSWAAWASGRHATLHSVGVVCRLAVPLLGCSAARLLGCSAARLLGCSAVLGSSSIRFPRRGWSQVPTGAVVLALLSPDGLIAMPRCRSRDCSTFISLLGFEFDPV